MVAIISGVTTIWCQFGRKKSTSRRNAGYLARLPYSKYLSTEDLHKCMLL